MDTNTAFALGLVTSALQAVFVMLSWGLTTRFGRRSIYIWGTGFNVVMLIALGIAACFPKSTASSNAQAAFGLIVSVMFTFAAAPVSWVIIAETSAIRLRPLTTGIGRASYYIINIPCIFRKSCRYRLGCVGPRSLSCTNSRILYA
jgi:SP family general alpha glucoside:H+ symporter-like MFS transporter